MKNRGNQYSFIRRLIAMVLCATMVLGNLPGIALLAKAAGQSAAGSNIDKVVDPATVDNWKNYFSNTSTENAGGVWTDKSVFATVQDYLNATGEAENADAEAALKLLNDQNFLVALSAIASTKTIEGYSTIPTDTILILDVSGSMATANADDDMVNAANQTIQTLLSLNEHNRVGVVLYSGSLQGAASNEAMLLLPLDRYTPGDTYTANRVTYQEYLKFNNNTVLTGDNLKNAAGKTVSSASRKVVGATYIQSGLYTAMEEFLDADTTITGDVLQAGVTRMPVTVLMTDGDPTIGTTSYTDPGSPELGNGRDNSNELNFVTQMSAAYHKAKVEEHYGVSSLFYTLGLGDVAMSVLDPTKSNSSVNGYWSDFLADGRVSWQSGRTTRTVYHSASDTITLNQYSQYRYYTTKYFSAQSANSLNAAFQSIVDAITLQSMYYPTHVEGSDFDNGGYLEFRDYIGEGMEVKTVKGVQHGNVLYTGKQFAYNVKYNMGTVEDPTDAGNEMVWAVMDRLHIEDVQVARDLLVEAWNAGQLAYDDETGEFSNYLGVYLDASGRYLGFWDGKEASFASAPAGAFQAVKCYYMFGEVGEGHRETDMLYASIQVRTTIATGEQIVYGRLPASLIPLIQYNVQLNTDSIYTATEAELSVTMTTPSRLIFEVGLDSDIDINTLAAGTHTFYTNQWEAEIHDGEDPSTAHNTFVSFQPSDENERYVYHEDMPVYQLQGGQYVRYTGTAAPTGTGFYRAYAVFSTSGDGIELRYEAISAQILTADALQKTEEGYWVVKKGTVYRFDVREAVEKTENLTGTLDHCEHPIVHMEPAYHLDAVLGNNGKLTIQIQPPKTVSDAEGNDIDGQKVMAGDELTYSISATNYEETASTITITDKIPAGTSYVPGSADNGGVYANGTITWAFTNVPAGETRTVSFKVTVSDPAVDSIENAATIQIGSNDPYTTNTTKNYPEGKVTQVTVDPVGENGVKVGSHITYTIYYYNAEAVPAKVTITDTVPEGTSFVSAEHGGTHDKDKNIVTWTIASVPAGTSGSVSFQVRVNASARVDINNTATIQVGENAPQVNTNSVTNELSFGDLVLKKTLASGHADTVFTLVLQSGFGTDNALNGTFDGVTFDKGRAEVQIKGGETVTIRDLPAGITVSVFEKEAAGYTPSYSSDDVTILENGTVTLDVTNHYSTVSAGLILQTEKTLTGRTLIEGMYHFLLKDTAGITVAVGTNEAPAAGTYTGKVTLGQISFAEAGTYSYTLSERNDGLSGVSYDEKVYQITVVVEDDMAGKLYVASVSVDGNEVYSGTAAGTVTVSSGVQFKNEFSTDDLLVPIVGMKELKNESGDPNLKLEAGEFVFEIADENGTVIRTGTNDASGKITFTALEFNFDDMQGAVKNGDIITKTFTYYVSEDIPEANRDLNMLYDTTKYQLEIVVRYDAKNASWDYDVLHNGTDIKTNTADTLKFTNIQYPSSINVPIQVQKTTDYNAPDGTYFSFSVYKDATCKEIVSGGTGAVPANTSGAYTFTQLNFTDAGEYTYYIRETKAGTSDNGITYDTAVYKVVIDVYRVNGELKYDLKYFQADGKELVNEVPAFRNDYQASGYLTLQANKVLNGRDLADGEFSFYVVDANGTVVATATNNGANITFSTIYYSLGNGGNVNFKGEASIDLTYVMYEEQGILPGVTYDTNRYKITVRLTNDNGAIRADVISVVNEASGAAVDGTVTFTNTYAPIHGSSISVTVDKELAGRPLRDGEFGFRMYLVELKDGKFELVTGVPVASAANTGSSATLTRYYPATAKAGTYFYKIVETAGNTPGVTYDGSYYIVEVKLEDDGNGSLTSQIISVVKYNADDTKAGDVSANNGSYTVSFHNSYNPGAVNFAPVIYKTLFGRDMVSGEFRFQLTGEGNTYYGLSAGAVDGKAAEIVFNSLTFTAKGEYKFTIKELNEGLGGVSYDADTIYMVVTVTDNTATGQLEAVAKYYSDGEYTQELTGEAVGFVNTYKPTAIQIAPGATKHLDGKNLEAGEFTFELKDENGKVIAIGTNNASGHVTFRMLDANGQPTDVTTFTYTGAGVHTYTVSEVKGTDDRYTYSEAVYTVTVTVLDDGKGNLTATYHYLLDGAEVGSVAFYNTFTPDPIEVDLDVSLNVDKIVNDLAGSNYSPAGFEFEVYNWNGELVATGKSDENGKVTFDNVLTFEAAGDYRFVIKEKNTGSAGITYDETLWVVHIQVIYHADTGILEAKEISAHKYDPIASHAEEPSDHGTKIEFINTYDPADVTAKIDLLKHLSVDDAFDRVLRAGEFTFRLMSGEEIIAETTNDAAGNVSFEIGYDKVGTYNYTVQEVIPEGAVQQTDGSYVLNGITYSTEKVNFTVVVTADGAKLVAAVSHEGESVTITNTYAAQSVQLQLEAQKDLTGRDLVEGEFSFTLEGEGVNETISIDANGNVTFSAITYDAVGTYTYKIFEVAGQLGGVTYSDVVYTATVTVIDNGVGQLVAEVSYTFVDAENVTHEVAVPVFYNVYKAEAVEVILGATKTLSGRDQISDEFQFVLTDEAGNTVTAGNGADGSIVFDAILFENVGTYTYTLTETQGTKGGVTYDENVYTVTVVITDNGKGNLEAEVSVGEKLITADENRVHDLATFENSYAAEKVTVDYLEAMKELTGRDLTAGEFEFVLTDKDGNVVASGKNDANGKITFSAIEYTATGIYTYTLSEVKGNVPGVTYSDKTFTVIVIVKDDGLGKLYVDSVSVDHQQITDGDYNLATITNTYRAQSVEVELEAEKELTGRDMVAGEFFFELLGGDLKSLEIAANAADGSVNFSKLTYTTTGTYTYYIVEQFGAEEGMTYDDTIIKVVVHVVDNGLGNLVATVTYSEDAVFHNHYEKPVEPPTEPTEPETEPTEPETEPTEPETEPTEPETEPTEPETEPTEPETEPTEPETEPTEPETEPTEPDTGDNPQTGDETLAHRAVMMMLFCVAAATVLLTGRKKLLA